MPVEQRGAAGVIIQERDLAVLRGLFECRGMTGDHISAICFEGRREATKKRLQRLKAAGVIRERPRRPYEPAVLFLTAKGLTLLRDRGILREYPSVAKTTLEKRARISDLTLKHELEVVAVK